MQETSSRLGREVKTAKEDLERVASDFHKEKEKSRATLFKNEKEKYGLLNVQAELKPKVESLEFLLDAEREDAESARNQV